MSFAFKKLFAVFVVAFILFSVVLVPVAHAVDPGAGIVDAAAKLGASGGCGFTSFFTTECALSISVGILTFIGTILGWVAGLFDFIMEQTIISGNYNANQPIIAVGWFIVRDLANIIIVLSILAISVGTILQMGGYSIKQTLPRLLIAGLLVNFSLPLAGIVVDLTNVLAFSFWEGAKGASGSISEVLIRGFELPKLLLLTAGPDSSTLFVLITAIFGIIFMLIFIFILLSFSFMFIARMLGLWVLLLLSPAAFVAMAVPGLQGYAKQWWDGLIQQSVFAPVSLLLVFVVSKVIQSGLTGNLFAAAGTAPGASFINSPTSFINSPTIILNYIALAGILLYSLQLAKDFGGHSATLGNKAFDKVRGYSKQALWSGGVATRLRQRTVGRGLETVATSRPGQSVLRATAFLGTGAATQAAIARGQKAREHGMKRDAGSLKGRSPADQARMLGGMTAAAQTMAIKSLKEKDREKVFKEMKKLYAHTPDRYNRIMGNVQKELANDKDKTIKNYGGFEAGDVAKALAANDLEMAVKFDSPNVLINGALPTEEKHGKEAYEKAQRAVGDLIAKTTDDVKGSIIENYGGASTVLGSYVREDFKKNGDVSLLATSRKRVEASNKMFTEMFNEETLAQIGRAYSDVELSGMPPDEVLELHRATQENALIEMSREMNKAQGLDPENKKTIRSFERMKNILLNPGGVSTSPKKKDRLDQLEGNLEGKIKESKEE